MVVDRLTFIEHYQTKPTELYKSMGYSIKKDLIG